MSIQTHSLGIHGVLIEDTDRNTVKYKRSGDFMSAFEVRIADVTGVSWRKNGLLSVIMIIHGQGAPLAELKVNHGATEKIDAWFKERIGLGATRTSTENSASMSLVDEVRRLAQLREDGLLTDEEFVAGKKKILGL